MKKEISKRVSQALVVTTLEVGLLAGAAPVVAMADNVQPPIPSAVLAQDKVEAWMPDPELRAVLVQRLKLPNEQALTRESLSALTTLKAQNYGIKSLKGLEFAPNLRVLNVSLNQITDLTPIQHLTQLEEAQIFGNKLTDLTPLTELKALKVVNASSNPITSLNGLGDLPQIESLWLKMIKVTDQAEFEKLGRLTTLQDLALTGNRIEAIDFVSNLHALKQLELSANKIESLAPVAELTQLEALSANQNKLTDITPVTKLTNLREFSVIMNKIGSVEALRELTELRDLQIGINRIHDLEPLGKLTHLVRLGMGSNAIQDLAPISHLTTLTEVNAGRNQIADLSPLQKLPKLAKGEFVRQKVSAPDTVTLSQGTWHQTSAIKDVTGKILALEAVNKDGMSGIAEGTGLNWSGISQNVFLNAKWKQAIQLPAGKEPLEYSGTVIQDVNVTKATNLTGALTVLREKQDGRSMADEYFDSAVDLEPQLDGRYRMIVSIRTPKKMGPAPISLLTTKVANTRDEKVLGAPYLDGDHFVTTYSLMVTAADLKTPFVEHIHVVDPSTGYDGQYGVRFQVTPGQALPEVENETAPAVKVPIHFYKAGTQTPSTMGRFMQPEVDVALLDNDRAKVTITASTAANGQIMKGLTVGGREAKKQADGQSFVVYVKQAQLTQRLTGTVQIDTGDFKENQPFDFTLDWQPKIVEPTPEPEAEKSAPWQTVQTNYLKAGTKERSTMANFMTPTGKVQINGNQAVVILQANSAQSGQILKELTVDGQVAQKLADGVSFQVTLPIAQLKDVIHGRVVVDAGFFKEEQPFDLQLEGVTIPDIHEQMPVTFFKSGTTDASSMGQFFANQADLRYQPGADHVNVTLTVKDAQWAGAITGLTLGEHALTRATDGMSYTGALPKTMLTELVNGAVHLEMKGHASTAPFDIRFGDVPQVEEKPEVHEQLPVTFFKTGTTKPSSMGQFFMNQVDLRHQPDADEVEVTFTVKDAQWSGMTKGLTVDGKAFTRAADGMSYTGKLAKKRLSELVAGAVHLEMKGHASTAPFDIRFGDVPQVEEKPDVKPEEPKQPEAKPEVKPEEPKQPETKPEVKPEEPKQPESKPEVKPEEPSAWTADVSFLKAGTTEPSGMANYFDKQAQVTAGARPDTFQVTLTVKDVKAAGMIQSLILADTPMQRSANGLTYTQTLTKAQLADLLHGQVHIVAGSFQETQPFDLRFGALIAKQPEVKPQPKPEEPKQPEAKPEVKPEEPKQPEAKPQPKPEVPKQPDAKPQPKPEVPKQPDAKPQPKPEVPKQPETKPQPKPKPEGNKPQATQVVPLKFWKVGTQEQSTMQQFMQANGTAQVVGPNQVRVTFRAKDAQTGAMIKRLILLGQVVAKQADGMSFSLIVAPSQLNQVWRGEVSVDAGFMQEVQPFDLFVGAMASDQGSKQPEVKPQPKPKPTPRPQTKPQPLGHSKGMRPGKAVSQYQARYYKYQTRQVSTMQQFMTGSAHVVQRGAYVDVTLFAKDGQTANMIQWMTLNGQRMQRHGNGFTVRLAASQLAQAITGRVKVSVPGLIEETQNFTLVLTANGAAGSVPMGESSDALNGTTGAFDLPVGNNEFIVTEPVSLENVTELKAATAGDDVQATQKPTKKPKVKVEATQPAVASNLVTATPVAEPSLFEQPAVLIGGGLLATVLSFLFTYLGWFWFKHR